MSVHYNRFDNEQIAHFSMDLQHSQTTYASQTYQQIDNMNEQSAIKDYKTLRPLFDFIAQFEKLKVKADELLIQQEQQFEKLYLAVLTAEYGEDVAKVEQFNKVIGTEGNSTIDKVSLESETE